MRPGSQSKKAPGALPKGCALSVWQIEIMLNSEHFPFQNRKYRKESDRLDIQSRSTQPMFSCNLPQVSYIKDIA